MQLNCALILSAGMGTRMGQIGKLLPKVLWPIFSKKLIDLQIDYCRDLGIKNIYINIHFLAEDIKKHIEARAKDDVEITLLYEDPLLDSGGAIHNLARRPEINYSGNILLVNGDQFLFFSHKYIDRALEKLATVDVRASLFGIKVPAESSYNVTILEDERLVDIQKKQGNDSYITYSGLGIVKLDGLAPVDGISKFFQTVVNYKHEKAYMITPDQYEYWDFGTADLFSANIKKIVRNQGEQKLLRSFLIQHQVDINTYSKFINLEVNSIDLELGANFIPAQIIYKNVKQDI